MHFWLSLNRKWGAVKVVGLSPGPGSFVCGICTFSMCLCRFSLGSPASCHSPKTWRGYLETLTKLTIAVKVPRRGCSLPSPNAGLGSGIRRRVNEWMKRKFKPRKVTVIKYCSQFCCLFTYVDIQIIQRIIHVIKGNWSKWEKHMTWCSFFAL